MSATRFALPAPAWIVAAHPDDETIGAGATLAGCGQVEISFVTGGAPRDPRLWPERAAGETQASYAELRRREAVRALALANVPAGRLHWLGAEDQQATRVLVELTQVLVRRLEGAAHPPAAIVTHAYEGGHPDHDAAAFAVHAALALWRRAGRRVPALWEMTAYHADGTSLRTGHFLPGEGTVHVRVLDADERDLKRRMFDAYASQQAVLRAFEIDVERFRRAPRYAFSLPPHPGTPWYEQLGWMSGSAWRARAVAAARAMGLGENAWL